MPRNKKKADVAWKPGFWKRFPWLGVGACIAFLITSGAIVAALCYSDDQEVSSWPSARYPVSVAVLLSILVNVANVNLAVAMSQGYAVCWWLKALKGARLAQLQFDLDVQHSLKAFTRRSRTFDRFSVAAVIAMAVSVADGPLLQQATTSTLKVFTSDNTTVIVYVSPEKLPSNFSDWGGSAVATGVLQPVFANVSKAYASRDDIILPNSGCEDNSTCLLSMPGPGFDVSCSESLMPYDFYAHDSDNLFVENNTTAFQVSFEFGGKASIAAYSMVNFTALYKLNAPCTGSFTVKRCVMRLATVAYPVTVSNNTATIQKWQPSMNETIEIAQFNTSNNGLGELYEGCQSYDVSGLKGRSTCVVGHVGVTVVDGDDDNGFRTMLGGIVSVAESLYRSSANLVISEASREGFLLGVSGQSASNYLTSQSSTYGDCKMTWGDPSVDIVNTIRELMFRSAIANSMANASYATPQQLPGTSTKVVAAYVTHYQYLGIALGIMILQMGVVFFLLGGWQALGRKVSLDTFEISKALGAPVLREVGSNRTIDKIVKIAGNKSLRYGEWVGKDAGETKAESSAPLLSPSDLSISAQYPLSSSGRYEPLPQGNIASEMDNTTAFGYERESLRTTTPQLRLGEVTDISPARPNVLYY